MHSRRDKLSSDSVGSQTDIYVYIYIYIYIYIYK